MMDKIARFVQMLEAEKKACLSKAKVLAKDECKDEANMSKIRANIFDIIMTVARTAEKQSARHPIDLINEKIGTMEKAWEESLFMAEKHTDHEKAAIERVKLLAIAEISRALANMTEAAQ